MTRAAPNAAGRKKFYNPVGGFSAFCVDGVEDEPYKGSQREASWSRHVERQATRIASLIIMVLRNGGTTPLAGASSDSFAKKTTPTSVVAQKSV